MVACQRLIGSTLQHLLPNHELAAHPKLATMEQEPIGSSMKMASLVVGSSTLYSRSKSSIHHHTMLVSLKKAARHEPVNEHAMYPYRPQQPRSELMGRFRVNQSSRKRKRKVRNVDESVAGMPKVYREEQHVNGDPEAFPKFSLINQVHSQLFPHDVGPNGEYSPNPDCLDLSL